jgi:hypothetical protein
VWRPAANQFVLATSPLRLTTSNFTFQTNTCRQSLFPQEQDDPVISSGTGFNTLLFSARLYRLARIHVNYVTKTCLSKRWLLRNGCPTVDCVTSRMCLPICFRGYIIIEPLPSILTSSGMNVGGSRKGFPRVLRVPQPILIPPTAPRSLNILSLTLYGLDTDGLVKYLKKIYIVA